LLPSHAFVENLALRFAHQKNGHIGHVDGNNMEFTKDLFHDFPGVWGNLGETNYK
jgi:hypothetical protein